MALHTFRINHTYGTVDTFNPADAMEEAVMGDRDGYELMEAEGFEARCLQSALSGDGQLAREGILLMALCLHKEGRRTERAALRGKRDE
ncbi:MAG TPA: hypothetical protein VGJ94_06030 [Syntrophorhabdaceae bacterium]|jgi:hypothetical protein